MGLPVSIAQPTAAYSIDCAILLCIAGGFPASVECSAAHAEMIRRITPWPIEPPLQLWRCPMGGADKLLPDASENSHEIRFYRKGIEVWQLSKRSMNSSGGRQSEATAVRSFYDDAGNFQRVSVAPLAAPPWVIEQVRLHAGVTLLDDFGNFNAILMRHHDYLGQPSYEWASY